MVPLNQIAAIAFCYSLLFVLCLWIDGFLKRKEIIISGRLNNFFMLLDKFLPEAIKKINTNHSMKKLKPDNNLAQYLAPALVPVQIKSWKIQYHLINIFIQKLT
jgi:hypothetical protein